MRTQRNSWAVQFQESFLLSDSNYMDLSSLTIGGYKEVQYLWTKSGLFPIYTIKGDINCHIQFWEVTRLVESFKNINRKKCIHVACVCVYVCVCVCVRSVVSDSLQPHELQPTRLLCPWNFPSKNTGLDLPFPAPGDLPDPGIELTSLAFPGRFFTTSAIWEALM